MAQWRIKEISDLTSVSVRMLHHYDKIGLLKPSGRSSNGYRWYSEQDLAVLQQIVALKFFGFGLKKIQEVLEQELSIAQHLQAQQDTLQTQINNLTDAKAAITKVLKRMETEKSVNWNDSLTLIERYRMAQKPMQAWAQDNLSPQQLAEWTRIEKESPREYEEIESIMADINGMKLGDPEGPNGERIVKALETLTKKIVAHETDEARYRRLELNIEISNDVKENKIPTLPLTPEGQHWLSRASLKHHVSLWEKMYEEIRTHLTENPESTTGKKIAANWRSLIKNQLSEQNGGAKCMDTAIGTMLWEVLGREKRKLQERTTLPTPQEQLARVCAKIALDHEAISWIDKALKATE